MFTHISSSRHTYEFLVRAQTYDDHLVKKHHTNTLNDSAVRLNMYRMDQRITKLCRKIPKDVRQPEISAKRGNLMIKRCSTSLNIPDFWR